MLGITHDMNTNLKSSAGQVLRAMRKREAALSRVFLSTNNRRYNRHIKDLIRLHRKEEKARTEFRRLFPLEPGYFSTVRLDAELVLANSPLIYAKG